MKVKVNDIVVMIIVEDLFDNKCEWLVEFIVFE